MAVKPTDGHIQWITDDDTDKYIAPSAGKRLQGWIKEEKPPFQYFNWFWRLVDRWLQWAEAQSDENVAAIAAEVTDRQDGDTALQADIDDEAAARAAADTTLQGDLSAHTADTSPHSASSSPTADRLVLRDASGRASFAAATEPDNAVILSQLAPVISPGTDSAYATSVAGVGVSKTELLELDLGDVTSGDYAIVYARAECGDRSTNVAYTTFGVDKKDGTASCSIGGVSSGFVYQRQYHPTGMGGLGPTFVLATELRVTASGTLVLALYGQTSASPSTVDFSQLHIQVRWLRKQ